jgi:hypothetical protein
LSLIKGDRSAFASSHQSPPLFHLQFTSLVLFDSDTLSRRVPRCIEIFLIRANIFVGNVLVHRCRQPSAPVLRDGRNGHHWRRADSRVSWQRQQYLPTANCQTGAGSGVESREVPCRWRGRGEQPEPGVPLPPYPVTILLGFQIERKRIWCCAVIPLNKYYII